MKYEFPKRKQFAVYEKIPAHQGEENGVILAPYNSEEEANNARMRLGYSGDNYYVDEIKLHPKID